MNEGLKLKPEAIRTNLGMNQTEFAKKLGLSVRVYQKRIKKQSEWKISEVSKLSELGNIPMDRLEL